MANTIYLEIKELGYSVLATGNFTLLLISKIYSALRKPLPFTDRSAAADGQRKPEEGTMALGIRVPGFQGLLGWEEPAMVCMKTR